MDPAIHSPTSPTAGPTPTPPAPSDPVGTAPVTTSDQPGAQPTATSVSPPAPGTPAPPPTPSSADLALEALLAENAAPSQPNPPAASTAPTEPPAPATTTPEPPPPAPPAATDDGDDPTPDEVQAKAVPLKKLTRALETRRAFKEELTQVKTKLEQEQALTDQVLTVFNAAGVQPDQLRPFLATFSRVRSDPQAQADLLKFLGIQAPAAAKPAIDVARLHAALDAYDVDAIKSHLASAGILPAPAAHAPPAPATPVVPPAPVQPPPTVPQPTTRTADPAPPNVLIQTVATMGSVLRAQYGHQEAQRLANLIDAEAKTRITDLESLRVPVTVEAAAEVWKRAQETVVRAESDRRAKPPQPSVPPAQSVTLRPQPVTPPASPKTADEQFAELAAGRA